MHEIINFSRKKHGFSKFKLYYASISYKTIKQKCALFQELSFDTLFVAVGQIVFEIHPF